MNPSSGPGSTTDPNYVSAVNKFTAAGGHVLIYVPSGRSGSVASSFAGCNLGAPKASYTAQDVVNCAQKYQGLYGTLKIDGVFVDEMGPRSGGTDSDAIAFYTQVYTGLKGLNSTWTIVGNPGGNVPQGYLRSGSSGAADTLVTFEDYAANYAGTPPSSYVFSYAATRFANILHTATAGYDFGAFLNTAQLRNVSYVYVTNDNFVPNPFDTLPNNWASQVAAVRNFNVGK